MESPPPSIAEAVAREIQSERVLWTGTPDRWAYASGYWRTALVGIPFATFAIFWTYQASQMTAKAGDLGFAVFFPLWGVMFIVIGLSMLLSPLWAAWVASKIYYAVTERRAIIFEKGVRLKIQSFPRSAVAGYERVSGGGSGGSIIFQRIAVRSGRTGSRVKEIGFIGLKEYAAAEQALNRLVTSAI